MSSYEENNVETLMTADNCNQTHEENQISKSSSTINIPKTPVSLLQVYSQALFY